MQSLHEPRQNKGDDMSDASEVDLTEVDAKIAETAGEAMQRVRTFLNISRVCMECGRRFDITIDTDCDEWYYGHDCES